MLRVDNRVLLKENSEMAEFEGDWKVTLQINEQITFTCLVTCVQIENIHTCIAGKVWPEHFHMCLLRC